MTKVIYENKKIAWKWVAIKTGKFGKPAFFKVSYAKRNKKPLTKIFAYICVTPFYFCQNNCVRQIGLCFLWWHVGLYFHR
jgi:hypothetical protein